MSCVREISLVTLLLLLPGSSSFGEAYLELISDCGTVVVDEDTLPPGDIIEPMETGRWRLTYLPVQGEVRWRPPLKALVLNLSDGETLRVDLRRTIVVRIESHPPGCAVYRGGALVGNTPALLSTILEYPDTLTLRKDGYLAASVSPEALGDGETCRVELLPDQHIGVSGRLTVTSRKSGNAWLTKYGSLATSLFSISLGFWYKSRADSYYDDYLAHGNPETMEHLYRESVKMDDRARIFWLVGEATALFTSYLFVKEHIFQHGRTQHQSYRWKNDENTR